MLGWGGVGWLAGLVASVTPLLLAHGLSNWAGSDQTASSHGELCHVTLEPPVAWATAAFPGSLPLNVTASGIINKPCLDSGCRCNDKLDVPILLTERGDLLQTTLQASQRPP